MSRPIRLQSYLAKAGLCSRRAAEKLILNGKVQVNGELVRILGTSVDPGDEVVVDGRSLTCESPVLYLFHKPRGVVTTLRDPHAPRTLEPIVAHLPERVFPVGRLDADVSGLLLLTNDGAFADRMLHPRYEVERTYVARVFGIPESDFEQRLAAGIVMEDGQRKSGAAQLLQPDRDLAQLLGELESGQSFVEVKVREGAKHFVKRLLKRAGHPVVRLSRIAFGEYRLGDLQPGEMRAAAFPESSTAAAVFHQEERRQKSK